MNDISQHNQIYDKKNSPLSVMLSAAQRLYHMIIGI